MQENKIQEAALMMMRTDRMHHRLFERAGEEFGMCRTHHVILMRLSHCEKIPTQRELADSLGITPAAVTGALKKLEDEGYLCRTAGEDSRKNEIAITERGRELVRRTHEVFSTLDSSLFDNFSDGDLETYTRLLAKLLENMEKKWKESGEKRREQETEGIAK